MIDVFRSPAGSSPVVVEALFPASPERLFDAWTKAEDLKRWFGNDPSQLGDIEIDLREGGAWRFYMCVEAGRREFLEGYYLIVQRAELLSFSWCHTVEMEPGAERKTPPSQVTISFQAEGAATRMRLEHREIVLADGRIGVRQGWINSFEALAAILAGEG